MCGVDSCFFMLYDGRKPSVDRDPVTFESTVD